MQIFLPHADMHSSRDCASQTPHELARFNVGAHSSKLWPYTGRGGGGGGWVSPDLLLLFVWESGSAWLPFTRFRWNTEVDHEIEEGYLGGVGLYIKSEDWCGMCSIHLCNIAYSICRGGWGHAPQENLDHNYESACEVIGDQHNHSTFNATGV